MAAPRGKEEAKKAILQAYELLPFCEISDSNAMFIEQLDVERMMIDAMPNIRSR